MCSSISAASLSCLLGFLPQKGAAEDTVGTLCGKPDVIRELNIPYAGGTESRGRERVMANSVPSDAGKFSKHSSHMSVDSPRSGHPWT